MEFKDFLSNSYTSYHAVHNAALVLKENGFTELFENDSWSLKEKGKYFVIRDGSAIIAFVMGKKSYNIVACHTDSPVMKLKGQAAMKDGFFTKLDTETYGGGLLYSFLDRPLKLAGRVIVFNKENNTMRSILVESDYNVIIPSLAIHMNREANKGLSLNPQIDMLPLVAEGNGDILSSLVKNIIGENEEVVGSDIFVTPDEKPFISGINGEFFSAPRLDDLCGVYGALESIIKADGESTAVMACFDNEEVGSSTKQGAGGTFLKYVIKRIGLAQGIKNEALQVALSNSFMVSMDNAHSMHPNHPEKNDPVVKPVMNKGIVIKHHANQNYTTDAFSSAIIKHIFDKNNVAFQDFYMRSDMPCGGTLGAISSRQLSIRSVDIGLAQLAMHSAVETIGSSDIETLIKGLTAFYNSDIITNSWDKVTIK